MPAFIRVATEKYFPPKTIQTHPPANPRPLR